jgi:hypothetical protein
MPYKISYLEPVATVRPVTRLNDSAATWLLWRRRRRPIVNDISRKDIPDHPLAKGRVGHSLGFKKRQDPPVRFSSVSLVPAIWLYDTQMICADVFQCLALCATKIKKTSWVPTSDRSCYCEQFCHFEFVSVGRTPFHPCHTLAPGLRRTEYPPCSQPFLEPTRSLTVA